jgi:hypothetical protein
MDMHTDERLKPGTINVSSLSQMALPEEIGDRLLDVIGIDSSVL